MSEVTSGGGGFGRWAASRNHGIVVNLPTIPLFVPAQARNTLNALVHQTMRLALLEVAGRVSDAAGRFADTGALAQSFQAYPATTTGGQDITGSPELLSGMEGRVFSSLPYAVVMEYGRRAGQPIGRSGIDAIGLWAQRKLGVSAADAENVKWAIAKQIVAQGIEGKYYFEEGVQQAAPRVQQMFQILGQQLASALLRPGAGQTGTA